MLFFSMLGGSYLLERARPAPFLQTRPELRILLAACGALLTFGVAGWALATLRRHGTPPEPTQPTTALVMDGPFRFSRNPLYLALGSLLTSFAFVTASWWMLLAVPLLLTLLHFLVVGPEERYLSSIFGEGYDRYRRRTRRWL